MEVRALGTRGWKVGELAKRVDLTVRTLHHYDRIGLFSPSQTTESGHRLYADEDLRKLHQIISLKQLGFSLKEIKATICNPAYDPLELLRLQLSRFNDEINTLVELRDQVLSIYNHLQVGHSVSGEEFLRVIQMLHLMRSPYFSSKQLAELQTQYFALGATERDELTRKSQHLLAEFRRYHDEGRSTEEPDVLALARRWKDAAAFGPADEALVSAAEQYYMANPDAGLPYGMDGALYRYIKQAISRV
jgi:MerR family transcriptional regulator, thiopeptide resistance regulator